jgi:hypothetical protein
MDIPTILGTFNQQDFQQLMNQVQLLTRTVLISQSQNQPLLPPISFCTFSNT